MRRAAAAPRLALDTATRETGYEVALRNEEDDDRRFPGYRPALTAFLITQMFPAAILILPIYNIILHLGLLNQKLGLVLAYCTTAVPGHHQQHTVDLAEADLPRPRSGGSGWRTCSAPRGSSWISPIRGRRRRSRLRE
jgi:hypothetical protein